jgi:hypothetical protein
MYETGNRVLIYYSSSPRLGLAPSVLVMPRFPLPANRAATASHADSDQQGRIFFCSLTLFWKKKSRLDPKKF